MTPAMVAFIEEKVRLGWSPEQIGGWLKHRQAELVPVSYERIYWHVWLTLRNRFKRQEIAKSDVVAASIEARLSKDIDKDIPVPRLKALQPG